MATAAGSVAPKTRKGRAAPPARPNLKFYNNSTTTDSATALRLQRLRLLGIIGRRAELLASLAWETANG